MVMVFEFTEEHLALLQNFWVEYDKSTEFGAPRVCPKKPYGNSDVYDDIAESLGIEPPDDEEDWDYALIVRMTRLHRETEYALQIVLQLQTFETGIYINEFNEWRKLTDKDDLERLKRESDNELKAKNKLALSQSIWRKESRVSELRKQLEEATEDLDYHKDEFKKNFNQ